MSLKALSMAKPTVFRCSTRGMAGLEAVTSLWEQQDAISRRRLMGQDGQDDHYCLACKLISRHYADYFHDLTTKSSLILCSRYFFVFPAQLPALL